MTGAERIAAERQRQIEKEGWTPEHDDEHDDSSLLLAAICYAAPERIYRQRGLAAGMAFIDPWPRSWDNGWDKRYQYGERKENPGNVPPDPSTYTHEERIDLLAKAGALIAAEIDRLERDTKEPATDALATVSDAQPVRKLEVVVCGTPVLVEARCDQSLASVREIAWRGAGVSITSGEWIFTDGCGLLLDDSRLLSDVDSARVFLSRSAGIAAASAPPLSPVSAQPSDGEILALAAKHIAVECVGSEKYSERVLGFAHALLSQPVQPAQPISSDAQPVAPNCNADGYDHDWDKGPEAAGSRTCEQCGFREGQPPADGWVRQTHAGPASNAPLFLFGAPKPEGFAAKYRPVYYASPAPDVRPSDALRLILPMAKAYAASNPVGANAAYIEQAEQVLASQPAVPVQQEPGRLRQVAMLAAELMQRACFNTAPESEARICAIHISDIVEAAIAAPTVQAALSVPDGHASGIDANDLEKMAKERADECFLKGSGILKLIGAIRQLEREARQAAPSAPSVSADAISILRDAVIDAADEWSQYVEVDNAPRRCSEHIGMAFDAAIAAQSKEGQQPTQVDKDKP